MNGSPRRKARYNKKIHRGVDTTPMPTIHKFVMDLVTEQLKPAVAIKWLVARKLKAQGVKNPRAIAQKVAAQVSKHFATGSGDMLHVEVDHGNDETQQIALEFTEAELNEYGARILEAMQKALPSISEGAANVLLSGIQRGDSEELRERKAVHSLFESNLNARWGRALRSYELFLAVAQEFSAEVAGKLARSKSKRNRHLVEALIRMHARACQVAGEVLVLIRSGYADGAHARWRTLHEMAVTCGLLSEHGDLLAERYLLHEVVDSYKGALQYNQHAKRLGQRPFSDRQIARMRKDVDRLRKRFGKDFRNPYGWSAEVLKNPDPNFNHLEQAANLDHLRPYYKLASQNVHATAKGSSYRLGVIHDQSLLLAGPSNAGLEEPGRFAIHSLLQITLCLLFVKTTIDSLVHGQILGRLYSDVERHFLMAARRLERDDRRVRRG